MDGSAFSKLPVSFIFSWPVLIIFCIGLLVIVGALGFGAYWVISHLAWVW